MLLILNDTELQQRLDTYRGTVHEVVQNLHVIGRHNTMAGNGTTISIEPNATESDVVRVRSEREVDEWAAMLSLGKSFSLYLAFNEDWHRVPPDKSDWRRIILTETIGQADADGRRRPTKPEGWWLFAGLRLRFYVGCESSAAPTQGLYQWLRCEWEPYDFSPPVASSSTPRQPKNSAEIAPALIFPGGVAAHPHFHFDSVPLNSAARAEANSRFTDPRAFTEQVAEEAPQFGQSVGPDWILQSSSTALGHLHLPTITSWQHSHGSSVMFGREIPSASAPLPHQHYPKRTTELDQWFSWCVTYFKHQFGEYIQDR